MAFADLLAGAYIFADNQNKYVHRVIIVYINVCRYTERARVYIYIDFG